MPVNQQKMRSQIFGYHSLLFLGISCYLLTPFRSVAQITPDISLPVNSVVTEKESTRLIEGGTTKGTNLFHSFNEFSLSTGSSAYFNNSPEIRSIFSRVTGSSISNIDGLIRANGTANLFLLNSNGIIFGLNASLDIGGSFIGTTANRVEFIDGKQFSTEIDKSYPLLTISVPVGLGFGTEQSEIIVKGVGHNSVNPPFSQFTPYTGTDGLKVQPGKALALIGGDITIVGGILQTPGGQVELGSVDSGLVKLALVNDKLAFNYEEVTAFRDINLFQKALIDTSESLGGRIELQGRNITIRNGSAVIGGAKDSSQSGQIVANAIEAFEVSGVAHDGSIVTILSAGTDDSNTGGAITISAKKVLVQDGGNIITSSFSSGNSGSLNISASESIQVTGVSPINSSNYSSIATVNLGSGEPEAFTLNTNKLIITEGGVLGSSSFGTGKGGNVIANVSELTEISGVEKKSLIPSALTSTATGSGNAGSLTLNTAQLSLRNAGSISTSTFGTGNAGNLVVNASEYININGVFSGNEVDLPSGISSSVIIPNQVFKQLFNLSQVPSGNSGSVAVFTPSIQVTEGGSLFVSNPGTGDGGNIAITANSIRLESQGSITASTSSGRGGNVNLTSQNLFLDSSNISASAGNIGNGGNILINTNTLVALEDSNITANAFKGNGGNIQIFTQGLFSSTDSEIKADSEFGIDGVVDIQTLGLEVENSLTPLQDDFITSEQVVAGSCLARRNADSSSFVVTGSGNLPTNPDSEPHEWESLSKPTALSSERSQDVPDSNFISARPWKIGDPIVEAQSIVRLPDGRVLLGSESQKPASTESIICKT